jgi:photosystem II stability/assembly factor-like uncharacterized protein
MAKTKVKAPVRAKQKTRRHHARRRVSTTALVVVAVALASAIVVTALVLTRNDQQPSVGSAPVVGGDLHSMFIPKNSALMFVGGHEAVGVSRDAGASWTGVASLERADAMGWAQLGDTLFVGGHPGLEVSTDGGTTFEPRNDGLPSTDVHALGGAGSTLYAASPAAGFLVSSDEGVTWEIRNPQVGQGFMGALLVDPDDPAHVIAPDMQAGAVETTDGGLTWRALGGVPGAMWLSWDPSDRDRIVVSGLGTAALSQDGGRNWQPVQVPSGTSIVAIDPGDTSTWYSAAWSDGEALLSSSVDAGRTWTPM